MTEYLKEAFLAEYYLLVGICGDYLTEKERRSIYYDLASVFLIRNREYLDAIYEESNLPHFKEIKNLSSFERLCRTVEFAEKSGQNACVSEADRIILAQKRKAMRIKEEIFGKEQTVTRESMFSTLRTQAKNGNTEAAALIGYAENRGIVIRKDEDSSEENIRLAASWNNIFANLLGLSLWKEKCFADRLYTILLRGNNETVWKYIRSCNCDVACGNSDKTYELIEEAFDMGVINRGTYDITFAEVAFSKIVSDEDKRKLLLNRRKGAIDALSDIPFAAVSGRSPEFNGKIFESAPLKREDEVKKILRNMAVAVNCNPEVRRPLLLLSEDEYVKEMYASCIKTGFGAHPVCEIDAGTLTGQDFAGGKENIFLRGISDTKATDTVFLVRNCEGLDERLLPELVKVIDPSCRKRFKLFSPPVMLDLSEMHFVLIAKKNSEAAEKLMPFSDVLFAKEMGREERFSAVEAVFCGRAASYGIPDAEIEKESVEYLASLGMRDALNVIDASLSDAVYGGKKEILLSDFKAIYEEENPPAQRMGFGYIGGKKYA